MKLTDKQKKLGLTTALLVALGFNLSLPMVQNLSELELASEKVPVTGGNLPPVDLKKEDPNLKQQAEVKVEESGSKSREEQTIIMDDGTRNNIVYTKIDSKSTKAVVTRLNSEGGTCTSCGVRQFDITAPIEDLERLEMAMRKHLTKPDRHREESVGEDDQLEALRAEASEKLLAKAAKQCRGETSGNGREYRSVSRSRYADERYDNNDFNDDADNFESEEYTNCADALIAALKQCVGPQGRAVSCSRKNPTPAVLEEDAKEFFENHLSQPLRSSLASSKGTALLEKTKVVGDLMQDFMALIPQRYSEVRKAAKDLGVKTVNTHRIAFERSAQAVREASNEADALRLRARTETNTALKFDLETRAQMIDTNVQGARSILNQYSTMFGDRQYGVLGMLESRLRTGLDQGKEYNRVEDTFKDILINQYLRSIKDDKEIITSLSSGTNVPGGSLRPGGSNLDSGSPISASNRPGRGEQFAPAGQGVPGQQQGVRYIRQSRPN